MDGTITGVTVGSKFTLDLARHTAELIEVAAIIVIVIGVVASIGIGIGRWVSDGFESGFAGFKRFMGRGLLIGLDLLIAADVIKTITLAPTLENATVLAVLVLIRTFLGWTLQVEIEGRWPWQGSSSNS